jgi:hypothetical protein
MDRVVWVRGLTCEDIRHEPDIDRWVFRFGSNVSFNVSSPWRVLGGGRIMVGGADDGQWFGLPRPVEADDRAMELLRGRPVREFSVDPVSADVSVDFGDGLLLQVFNSSSGYEGWELVDESSSRQLVGRGGGGLAIWGALDP